VSDAINARPRAIGVLGLKNGTMPSNPVVLELVEEVLLTNRAPEDVCADHPELLWEVREGVTRAQRLEAQLTELFPRHSNARASEEMRRSWDGEDLPEIAGYQLETMIGSGGMGIVFKARHLKLNRLVALKMLRSGAFASRQESARFIREAEAVAGLQHPHIIQVHDVGEFIRSPYFTMEFIEGGNLAQQLDGVPQSASHSAKVAATLATAVAFAHRRGIVHRDLKPANILVAADGTLKIADFGLAWRVDSVHDLTMSGARLGTPSYMAPEQASGKSHAAGPLVDVYSLGAILYEMLTGRPPFLAATNIETERQVIAEEPARPSRLNSSVPRDLENICLKCLNKDPRRRYATADDLADDLQRFLDGKPVVARPVGRLERIWKWARRRPAHAILLAAITIGVVSFATAAVWWRIARATTIRAVDRDLAAVAEAETTNDWVAAHTALERAKARMGDLTPQTERGRIEQAERELNFVAALDAIRLDRAAIVDPGLDPQALRDRADRNYAAAFQSAMLIEPLADVENSATKIGSSAVRRVLVAALDEWAVCTSDKKRRNWLLNVAVQADTDDSVWAKNVRDSNSWLDRAKLIELAQTAPVEAQPIQLMTALAERLKQAGGNTVPFLTRVQAAHSSDFWANHALGNALYDKKDFVGAVRFFQAALAVRPNAAVAHDNMGVALAEGGAFAESGGSRQLSTAIPYLLQAIQLDPKYPNAHSNLGNCYRLTGQLKQAAAEYREAVRLDPASPLAHANLGATLVDLGRFADATREYETALRLDPKSFAAICNMGTLLRRRERFDESIGYLRQAVAVAPRFAYAHRELGATLMASGRRDEGLRELREALRLQPDFIVYRTDVGAALVECGQTDEALEQYRQAVMLHPDSSPPLNHLQQALIRAGRVDQVRAYWQKALDVGPAHFEAWDGYAELCLFLDRKDEYHRTCQVLLERFGSTNDPQIAARIALVCLLSPATDLQSDAERLIERATIVNSAVKNDDLKLAQTLLACRRNRPQEALKLLGDKKGGISANGRPQLIVVAMAFHRKGSKSQARKVLAMALDSPVWNGQLAVSRDVWIGHILRRESEQLILPHLTEFLAGSYRPVDNDERLAMSAACYFGHFYRALAQLHADAFAANPSLAGNPSNGHRYDAACAAALAAAGKGTDAANLSDTERARWREQARQWLRAELALKIKVQGSGSEAGRKRTVDSLAGWLTDPDFAGIRDPKELSKLPAAERAKCQELWDVVAAASHGKRDTK
jgi:serine/threonine-protein kinase